jgi:O-antigen ligase
MQREGVINKNLEERLDWFSNPTGVSDFSSWERKYMARRAWQEVEDSPFLGGGTGTSWRQVVGAHNQYLTMMQDHGVIGAVMLPLLVLAVSWRAQGDAKIIGILFSTAMLFLGFFSHNLLYQEFYLLPFGLMASMTQLSRSPIREQLLRDFADHDDVHSSLQFGSR